MTQQASQQEALTFKEEMQTRINIWMNNVDPQPDPDSLLTASVAFKALKHGLGLQLTLQEYAIWQNKPGIEYLCCYIGLQPNYKTSDQPFIFYFVDNISDQNQDYRLGETVIEKTFQNPISFTDIQNNSSLLSQQSENKHANGFNVRTPEKPEQANTSLTPEEAMIAIINWYLPDLDNWPTADRVLAFEVPITDISSFNASSDKINVFFGVPTLHSYSHLYFFLSTGSGVGAPHKAFLDLTKPVPPFKPELGTFNLLPESLHQQSN